jgi:hypothetical protein
LITPTTVLLGFSTKPFLKKLVITPDRAFGQAFHRKGCSQAFFEKACVKISGYHTI